MDAVAVGVISSRPSSVCNNCLDSLRCILKNCGGIHFFFVLTANDDDDAVVVGTVEECVGADVDESLVVRRTCTFVKRK